MALHRLSGAWLRRSAFFLLAAGLASAGLAQDSNTPPPAPESAEPPAEQAADPELRVIPLKDGIKELKRLRMKHFGQIRNTEIRQIGIAKLQEYTESKFYPHLLEIFAREGRDVREAILNLLADQKHDQADTTLAYAAIFDKDEWFRAEARRRLIKRVEEYRAEQAARSSDGKPDLATPGAVRPESDPMPPGLDSVIHWRIKAVIVNGLKQKNDTVAAAAANLAADLKLFDLIPALINHQVQGPLGGAAGVGDGDTTGALAYIMVGQQQAFVSDLEPVVGDSAVGFDPQLGVVTSGTVLAIGDASVVTYRTEIYYALRRLANAGWDGRKTDDFGFDQRKWYDWYTHEFLPYRKAVAEGTLPANPDGPG